LIQEGQFNAAIGLMRMIESNVPAPLYSALGQYENEINGVVAEYANSSVSATFEGDADVAVGFHLGALYEILPNKLSLGVSYRSEVDMKVAKGKVKGTEKAIDDIAKFNEAKTGIKGVLNSYNVAAFDAYLAPTEFPGSGFEATLPLPSNLNAGISFSPIDNLLLAFDFQWIGWGTYDDLALTFDNDLEVVSIKKYSDTFAYRLGAQYTVLNELDVRCGIYFDESPVEDKYLTPESPSTSKIAGSIGLSYRPIPNLSIDVALLRSVSIDGRDATSGDNKDKDDGINGRYEVEAWAPSIGLSFNF
jgi:long-chain fatty acid transport protein